MWQLDNRSPFAAERGWVRDRDGAEVWLVAVKATFDIRPDGTTEVAKEQPPVLRVPEYHGEPSKSSIKYEADLVLGKTTTDITVVGHAHAPPGTAATALDAGFRVGEFQKLLRVVGDRVWTARGATAPQPFTKMPLVYERAYGGADLKSGQPDIDWDWRNPVGCGFVVRLEHIEGVPLPNFELASHPIASWEDRPAPAGFGALCSHWQPRVSFAGTYDDNWMKTRQPLLPVDFDERFFQCAPADQQAPAFLTGGEPVALLNLSPLGNLRFVLPKVFLGFETHFTDGSREIHTRPSLHSVIIEPDFPRVSMVWHSALPCHYKVQKLERTVVVLRADAVTGSVNDGQPKREAA